MRTFKIFVLCGSLLFLACFLSAAYILFLRPMTLPIYQFEQRMSEQKANYMASFLSIGDATYTSDSTESPLEMKAAWVGKNRMIGRTQDGMDIYAIPRQDPHDYIMLTTEMFPLVIFRNTRIAPIQLSSFPADEIQLIAPRNSPRTHEPAIIKEVIDTLVNHKGIVMSGEAVRGANMRLNSKELPGLFYAVMVSEDKDGKVFLTERFALDDWIPAGPEFTNWFQKAVK